MLEKHRERAVRLVEKRRFRRLVERARRRIVNARDVQPGFGSNGPVAQHGDPRRAQKFDRLSEPGDHLVIPRHRKRRTTRRDPRKNRMVLRPAVHIPVDDVSREDDEIRRRLVQRGLDPLEQPPRGDRPEVDIRHVGDPEARRPHCGAPGDDHGRHAERLRFKHAIPHQQQGRRRDDAKTRPRRRDARGATGVEDRVRARKGQLQDVGREKHHHRKKDPRHPEVPGRRHYGPGHDPAPEVEEPDKNGCGHHQQAPGDDQEPRVRAKSRRPVQRAKNDGMHGSVREEEQRYEKRHFQILRGGAGAFVRGLQAYQVFHRPLYGIKCPCPTGIRRIRTPA